MLFILVMISINEIEPKHVATLFSNKHVVLTVKRFGFQL